MLAEFQAALRQAIAAEVGLGTLPEQVSLRLSFGSVLANATATLSHAAKTSAVARHLHASAAALGGAIVRALGALPGLVAAATGELSVGYWLAQERPARSATPAGAEVRGGISKQRINELVYIIFAVFALFIGVGCVLDACGSSLKLLALSPTAAATASRTTLGVLAMLGYCYGLLVPGTGLLLFSAQLVVAFSGRGVHLLSVIGQPSAGAESVFSLANGFLANGLSLGPSCSCSSR